MDRRNWHNASKYIKLLLKTVMLICVVFVGNSLYQSCSNQKAQQKLQKQKEKAITQMEQTGAGTLEAAMQNSTEQEMPSQPEILPEYIELYEQNNDLAGWLTVEGTVIDYPVMKGIDDEYYLDHDFEGNESKYGCLFVKYWVDVNVPGTNYVIYGHHMKDGSMFGQLKKYMEEDFFAEYPLVVFHSLYEKRTYEIIAVFLSQVYNEEDDVFKYYEFYQADTEEEFNDFYINIKKLSLYDTGVTAQYGDRFITLSTCAYHAEDGRLVVVAKEVSSP